MFQTDLNTPGLAFNSSGETAAKRSDYIFADREEEQQRLERRAKYATSGGAQCGRIAA
jgi:hypothetical protein